MSSVPPFPREHALCAEKLGLFLSNDLAASDKTCPDDRSAELQHISYFIPGEPTVELTRATFSHFLSRQLDTPTLDELYDRLWLVGRQSGQSIDPLHRQKIKFREIIPTEDARLHLVWDRNLIYIKPIPVCLFNHDFWLILLSLWQKNTLADDNKEPCDEQVLQKMHHRQQFDEMLKFDPRVAVGFLRSYSFLVQSRLDLIYAQTAHLIPADITWARWSRFIGNFQKLENQHVAKRYHYGQLRLSRLNWAVRIFRPSSAKNIAFAFYEIPHWSIRSYTQAAVAPTIFVFVTLSLILSSMQVALSVLANESSHMEILEQACWNFSILVLVFVAVVWLLFLVIPFGVICWQISWGFRHRGKMWNEP